MTNNYFKLVNGVSVTFTFDDTSLADMTRAWMQVQDRKRERDRESVWRRPKIGGPWARVPEIGTVPDREDAS